MDPDCQRRFSSAAVLTLITLAGTAQVATAQYREDGRDIILDAAGDPNTPDYNVTQTLRQRGFQLFASRDAAIVGFRGTRNLSWATDNYSPCDAVVRGFCRFAVHPRRNPAVWTFKHFEILTYAGAPPTEFARIAAVAPSVKNALGRGWTSLNNFALFRAQYEFGPADGQLATLFSGVTSTSDGSCRDFSGFERGSFGAGLPLLAASDCPETWPATGFGGDRSVPRSSWEALYGQQGAAFRFDYWGVPDSLKAEGPLGDRIASYGQISDHYREILEEYGSVIPGGTGKPKWDGYPLGLLWHFEMFGFTAPGLEDVGFWRATVINRSEDVYGTGVDYDSLYLGFQVGNGGSSTGGGDRYSWYVLPHRSAVVTHQSNYRGPGGPCSDSFRIPRGAVTCTTSAAGRGYGNGAPAIQSPSTTATCAGSAAAGPPRTM